MMKINQNTGSALNQVTVGTQRRRQTPVESSGFNQTLAVVGSVAAGMAGSFMGGPLAPVLSAVTSGSQLTRAAAGSSAGAQHADVMKSDRAEQYELIELQRQIQKESREIALISNMMKAKHDSAKSAIGNVRA